MIFISPFSVLNFSLIYLFKIFPFFNIAYNEPVKIYPVDIDMKWLNCKILSWKWAIFPYSHRTQRPILIQGTIEHLIYGQ